jgi:multicomponent Na+:H+ antiporter subunit D
MVPPSNNILILGPILAPLIGAILSLMLSRNNRAQRYVAVVASAVAFLCSAALLYQNWDIMHSGADAFSVQVYRVGNWLPPYGIVFVADLFSSLFSVMATAVVLGGMIYAVACMDKSVKKPVFMPAFLMMSVGLNGAFLTGDLFTMFVFIELMVIASVILTSISDDPLGLEAGIKYLLISAMGTLFLLIGIAAIYASFGTLTLADIARILETGERPVLAQAAAVMLTAAFLLKSAVFPFHFWQPDFHTTAPTPVHSVLSSVVVKVGVYGVIRLVTLLFVEEAPVIENILIVLGIIGIFFGSLGALRTYNAKRMLAYSTFGQIGFILVGIGWGSPLALVGALVYSFNHAFIKSSLLQLSGVVSSRTKQKVGNFVALAGAGKALRLTAVLYLLGALALAGVPPLNGFISKVALVKGGVESESWLALGLVVGGGLLTLLYMTRAYVLIFQQERNSDSAEMKDPLVGDSPLAPALLIAVCVGLGLYARPLLDVAQMAVVQMADTSQYINAVLGALAS